MNSTGPRARVSMACSATSPASRFLAAGSFIVIKIERAAFREKLLIAQKMLFFSHLFRPMS